MVEFKVKFNNRITEKISEYQVNKTKKNFKKMTIMFIIIGVFLTAYGLLNKLSEMFDYVCVGVGVFSLVFGIIFPKTYKKTIRKIQNKIEEESNFMDDLTEEVYKFDEEKVFIFTTRSDVFRSAVETVYDYFYNVLEDDECYILFISSAQCHVVFKDCLTKGTLEEFEKYLHSHFSGEKYIKVESTKNINK